LYKKNFDKQFHLKESGLNRTTAQYIGGLHNLFITYRYVYFSGKRSLQINKRFWMIICVWWALNLQSARDRTLWTLNKA